MYAHRGTALRAGLSLCWCYLRLGCVVIPESMHPLEDALGAAIRGFYGRCRSSIFRLAP